MASELAFEKPIVELKKKINELQAFMDDKNIDLSDELERLKTRLAKLEEETYSNMSPWDRVQIARHMDRPTTLDYIPYLFTDFVECHGDRLFGDDAAIVSGIASYHGRPVTIIGEQRGRDTKENLSRNFGMPHPEGYRKALRLMKQAEKFGRPIITFIDTKGAFPGKTAEERGQGEAIARNLFEMAGLEVPIVCIVIGEGASGGALAIGVGDRILMLENSWYSVIAPESAAALLWRDSTQAERAAKTMKITAPDLKELEIIDTLIPEIKGGAHHDIETQAAAIDQALQEALLELSTRTKQELVEQRLEKYRVMGKFKHETDFAEQS
ncbi:acetyl-coenzyme A carboxylase carboxyl transferase subunit alpha [Pullulanibacillus camelliae]|uniref:Acetyl-coenzyme A carboxylase carboxyl transferase subunit alpha n=1 Tax=Pullulanibacillus camelliae TaxID=1707096 RepID=A0A8J3E0S8_9BACL|nr:acetyl-CoA carboxylase carboxyl transferase subunit alpha [Pullulanibacillus camelliae]GGE52040.1 acetyl-coenzyme A carboxylase carboxyl transferase subunit alpha [Pullulanibacillus camelliae]